MAQTEALKQLREVHAIQGRDGCWDIDDYMLGLYNGLELALSIVENRACKYKQRSKAQPEQEPVAWGVFEGNLHDMFFSPSEAQEMADLKGTHAEVRPLYTAPPQRQPLTDEEVIKLKMEGRDLEFVNMTALHRFARAIEASHGIKE